MDMGIRGVLDRPHRREDTRARQMGRMRGDVSNNDVGAVADMQVGTDLTSTLVASRSQYAEETYADWGGNIRRVSFGVSPTVQTRDVNIMGGSTPPPHRARR